MCVLCLSPPLLYDTDFLRFSSCLSLWWPEAIPVSIPSYQLLGNPSVSLGDCKSCSQESVHQFSLALAISYSL